MKQNKWIVLSLVMCLVGITTSQALAYNGLGTGWRTNGEEINNDCTLPGDPVSPGDLNSSRSIKVLFR
jgi:hypothetical protein